MPAKIDLTGKTFPTFTVLSETTPKIYGKNNHVYPTWLCKCKCGKMFTAITSQIRSGKKKSCGCARKWGNRFSKQDPKIASWNGLINTYKQCAKRRKIDWLLSDKQAISLFKQNCFYCGMKPKQRYNRNVAKNGNYLRGNKERSKKAWITHNGIDRINNQFSYEFSNCVPSCKFCNFAKNNSSIEEFKEWLNQIKSSPMPDFTKFSKS